MKIQIDPIKMKGLCEQCNKISEVYKVTVSNENRSMSKLLCGSCATKAMKYVENMNQTTRAAASADAGTDADHQNLTPQTAKKGLRHSPQKRIITALLALLIVLSGAVIGTIAVIKSNKAKKGADSVDEASIGAIYYQETPAEHIAQTDVGIMYADNELLVVAKEGTAKAEVEQLASKYDAAIVGFIEATGDYQWQLNRVFSKDDLDACAAEIENEDIIDSACPNYIFEILENSVNDDINYGKEWKGDLENQTDIKGKSWGVEAIKAPAAWKLMDENKSKISPVAVGVIDNGFDESHDDLPKPKFFYNNSFNYRYSDLENQSDDMSHGTHVAGIFAANGTNSEGICGVYPYANDGGLFLASWDHENEYAENKSFVYLKVCFAELVLRNVKVINCSFGSGFGNKLMYMLERPEMENEAETYARDLAEVGKLFGDYFERFLDLNYDFVIVASAGNNSNEEVKIEIEINNNVETIAYETNDMLAIYNSILTLIPETQSKIYNRIIVVGAIDEAFHRCDFSDVGERVDIYAPGKKIYSTVPKNDYSNTHWQKNDDGKKITDDCSGTSQAAPHVAGVAASVWSMNKKLSGADVKSIVKNSINTEHLDLPIIDMEQAVKVAFGSIDNESFTEHLDPNHGAIMGWVVDRDSFTVSADNGIETGAITDAEIIVENAKTGDKTDGTYINDYNGHFEIILPPGKYNLTVNAAGYDPYTTPEPVEVNAQQVTYLDDWIKLKKKNTDKPNAEEIIDIYLKQYLMWSSDDNINLRSAGHKYQFLDLDFDGVPELVVSYGDGIREDSGNNYYHIAYTSKKIVPYSVIDNLNQSIIDSELLLVENKSSNQKEYRSSCYRGSRYSTSEVIKALSIKNGQVNDQSLYCNNTEYDLSAEKETEHYYKYGSSNSDNIEISKQEYNRIKQADKNACKDLHLKFKSIEGEEFDTLSNAEKKVKLLESFQSFTYDGFNPGYKKSDIKNIASTEYNSGNDSCVVFIKRRATYDKDDNIIDSQTFIGGNQPIECTTKGKSYTCNYDQMNHIIKQPALHNDNVYIYNYAYTNDGELYYGKASTGNLTSETVYKGSQLLSTSEQYKGETLNSIKYEYYSNGSIKSMEVQTGIIVEEVDHAMLSSWQKIIYSPEYQIVEEIRYVYRGDNYGNRYGDMTYTYEDGRLVEIDLKAFDPDTGEQLDEYCTQIKRIYHSDEKDILESDNEEGKTVCYYDSSGKLVKSEGDGIVDTFEYYDNGQIKKKTTVNENINSDETVVKVVEEYELVKT